MEPPKIDATAIATRRHQTSIRPQQRVTRSRRSSVKSADPALFSVWRFRWRPTNRGRSVDRLQDLLDHFVALCFRFVFLTRLVFTCASLALLHQRLKTGRDFLNLILRQADSAGNDGPEG